jgi:hypothetical protein
LKILRFFSFVRAFWTFSCSPNTFCIKLLLLESSG